MRTRNLESIPFSLVLLIKLKLPEHYLAIDILVLPSKKWERLGPGC
jgi:hypothetical protein